jgi:hypothetical protein
MTQTVRRDPRSPLSNEVLDMVYEQWICYPELYDVVPYRDHAKMAAIRGWWFSGRRGWGEDMLPLDPEIAERFNERDDGR